MSNLPVIAVIGPAGRLVINEVELNDYRSRGYRPESEPEPQVKDQDKSQVTGPVVEEPKLQKRQLKRRARNE